MFNVKYILAGLLLTILALIGFVEYKTPEPSEPSLGLAVYQPVQGGTGISTIPTYGQVLVGNSSGTYTLTATSSLGLSSGSSAQPFATSSLETAGQLAYWTSTSAFPATLGKVATTSLTATSPLSLSQAISVIGTSASALSLDTSGTWTGNAGTATALAANGANCSSGNAPLGVDASGAVESCFDVWTEAENTTAAYVPGTRTLTVAGTTNQITSSAGAQDLSANRTWTLSLPSLVIFPGNASSSQFSAQKGYFGGTATTTIDAAGNVAVAGTLNVTGQTTLATSLTGLAYTSSGVVSAITNGVLGTSGVLGISGGVPAYVATSSLRILISDTIGTLAVARGGTGLTTFGGSNTVLYTTAADTLASEAGFEYNATLNRITVTNATTTNLSVSTYLKAPYSAAITMADNGELYIDSTSGQVKYRTNDTNRVLGDGYFYPAFTYATSTAWTGTTTIPLGPAFTAEEWSAVKCFTDAGTLGVSFNDGTNRMDYIPTASTTVNQFTLSTNNTFTSSEKRYVDIGTAVSSPTKISCTVRKALTAD